MTDRYGYEVWHKQLALVTGAEEHRRRLSEASSRAWARKRGEICEL